MAYEVAVPDYLLAFGNESALNNTWATKLGSLTLEQLQQQLFAAGATDLNYAVSRDLPILDWQGLAKAENPLPQTAYPMRGLGAAPESLQLQQEIEHLQATSPLVIQPPAPAVDSGWPLPDGPFNYAGVEDLLYKGLVDLPPGMAAHRLAALNNATRNAKGSVYQQQYQQPLRNEQVAPFDRPRRPPQRQNSRGHINNNNNSRRPPRRCVSGPIVPRAPTWADANWHPMAQVVTSGQLANGGTGVFLPAGMAPEVPAARTPKGSQSSGLVANSPVLEPLIKGEEKGEESKTPVASSTPKQEALPEEWLY